MDACMADKVDQDRDAVEVDQFTTSDENYNESLLDTDNYEADTGKIYEVCVLRKRFEAVADVSLSDFVKAAVSLRLKQGEVIASEDMHRAFDKNEENLYICGKHYTFLFRIITSKKSSSCKMCQRTSEDKHLQPLNFYRDIDNSQVVFLAEIIGSIIAAESSPDVTDSEKNGTIESELLGESAMSPISDNHDDVYISKANQIIEERLRICLRCKMRVRRTIGRHVSTKPERYPDSCMEQVCVAEERRLLSKDGVGKYSFAAELYEKYCSIVSIASKSGSGSVKKRRTKDKPMSYTAFYGALTLNTGLCVLRNFSNGVKRGTFLASYATVKDIISDSSSFKVDDALKALSAETLHGHLFLLCQKFHAKRKRVLEGDVVFLDDLRDIPCELWCFTYAIVESNRERLTRRIMLEECKGDIYELPLPFGNQYNVTTEALYSLGRNSFRKLMRVHTILHLEAFALSPERYGSLVWSLSAGISSIGGDSLLKVCNQMGLCVHPNHMNQYKNDLMKSKLAADPRLKINAERFVAFAHDNIDADLNKTTLADGKRMKSFHGTKSVSQQDGILNPIRTNDRFKPLDESIQKPSVLLEENSKYVRSSQSLLLGIVATYGEHLLSSSVEVGTTIRYLLRRLLKGHCSGLPAKVEHLSFLELPSDSATTTRQILTDYLKVLEPRRTEQSPDYFLAFADMPLYVRLWELIYHNASPGLRNQEFESAVPVAGGFHFDMCLKDVVKRLCHHAFMSGLVPLSGLTEGAAARFLTMKDPKTNHRVFDQVCVASVRRIIDCLFESGDLSQDSMPGFKAHTVPGSLESTERSARQLESSDAFGYEDRSLIDALNLNNDYPVDFIISIGERVLTAIERRAERQGQHMFKHFALDLVVNTLIPCIMFHILSRAGQIRARTALVKHLAPALFVTGKHKYHRVMLFSLHTFQTAPKAVQEALFSADMVTTNLKGTNSFGNVEKDEALEETGVASTKGNAFRMDVTSLKRSVYTSGNMRQAFDWLRDTIRKPAQSTDWKNPKFEKRLCPGAIKMYTHLCGSEKHPPWLGEEHFAMPLLTNTTVFPHTSVTQAQQDNLLKLRTIGRENDRAGVRFIPELRVRASKEETAEANKRKLNKLEHFSEKFKANEAKKDKGL